MQAPGQVKHKSKMMDRVIWGWALRPSRRRRRRRRSAHGQTAGRRQVPPLGASAEEAAPRFRRRRLRGGGRRGGGRAGGRAGGEARDGAGEAREGAEVDALRRRTAKLARWLEDEDSTGIPARWPRARVEIEQAIFRVCRPEYEKKVRDLKANIKRPRSSATASSAGAPCPKSSCACRWTSCVGAAWSSGRRPPSAVPLGDAGLVRQRRAETARRGRGPGCLADGSP